MTGDEGMDRAARRREARAEENGKGDGESAEVLLGPGGTALARLISAEDAARRGAAIARPGQPDPRPNFPDAAIARLEIIGWTVDRIETSAARRAGELKVDGQDVDGGSMVDAIVAAAEARLVPVIVERVVAALTKDAS